MKQSERNRYDGFRRDNIEEKINQFFVRVLDNCSVLDFFPLHDD